MQTTQRAKQNTPEEQDKRKEKERKREEKELRKIAAAAGVRMAKPTTTATLAPLVPSAESKPVTGFKKGSWASVSSVTPEPPSYTESPPARSGWGAVGSSSSSSPAPDAISSAGFPTTTTPVAPSQPDDPSIREPAKEAQRQHHQPAPAFRTGGWSSIDSTTRVPLPPTPVPDVPASPIANVHRQQEHLPCGPSSTSITPSAPETVPAAVHLPPPIPPHSQAFAKPRTEAPPKSSKSKKEREAELRENSRSGWQSFQKGGRRK